MAKKKGGRRQKTGASAHKSKLAMLSQIVSSYRPKAAGGTYIKETEEELMKQVSYQHKPLRELMQSQQSIDSKRFEVLGKGEKKSRGAAFVNWMGKHAPNSFLGDKFDFSWDVEEGSGVVAKRDLKRHDHFIRVPRKVMVTSTQAGTSKLGEFLRTNQMFGTMPNLMLAVHLMFESLNPDSFWKPYIDVLPRSFTLPLFFTQEELENLKGSPTFYDALKIQKQTLRQYIITTKLLGAQAAHLKLPPFTYRDFRWAVGIVMTRQNRIPAKNDSEKHVLALIPGWDFCNFRDGELTTHFNDDLDVSESFTMEDVKAGDQIYIYYGNRPNSKLFLFSGFIADDHKTDYVEVLFTHEDPKSPIFKICQMMLAKRRLRPDSQPFRVSGNGAPSDICLTWARICCMDKKEATEVLKMKTALVGELSERNESKAWGLVCENVEKALKAYPTSLEQDLKLLGGTSLGEKTRVAVRMRIKEKRALVGCLQMAERVGKVSGGD